MSLGGGTWIFQNKVLPGAYINFKSQVSAAASVADRGYGAMPLELDIPSLSIVKGDLKSITISAASVIAKVTRLKYDSKMS